ncbi:hypothetical protein [Paenibacillus alba]|uniref:DUF3951 domain-containing protein n=1 Tax=Paenibacillus alba TaxID=1197127 RepID=A0ABU6GC02_9BACL|nr:hypothetical protein [Paenibacillus alba]MEC0231175.1 hypothetical protein [Paenibacillus alba]
MVNVILALCIPLTAVVMGYFTLKAVQLGLRWQIETKQQQLPTMEQPKINPFDSAPKQPVTLDSSILDEWVNGPKPESR